MKVLIVNYYYSWSSSVGSRRMRGLAKGLVAAGHEVIVVGATAPGGAEAAPIDGVQFISTPPSDRVLAARALVARVRPRRGEIGSPAEPAPAAPPEATVHTAGRVGRVGRVAATARARAARMARGWIAFPDTMWEWTHRAQRAVVAAGVRPDVIVASAPPMAGLHAASRLAHKFGCPWVADMRDLWTGDPYRITPAAVRWLDRRLERRVLSSAAAITTVAVSMVDELHEASQGVEVAVLRNGFDAEWMRSSDEPPAQPPRIIFTGTLTSNTGRSLDTLCDAVETMHRMAAGPAPLIDIVGAADRRVVESVARRGLTDAIRFRGVVDGPTARQAQHDATALLNFSWEDPRDFHKLPAKLFEYAASRRPIIHLGKVATLGTQLIHDHGLGFLVDPDDAEAVARLMLGLVDGSQPWTPSSTEALAPLSQRAMVEGFLAVIGSVSRDRS